MAKLPPAFYQHGDVLQIARTILGKSLYTRISGKLTGGTIVETEAYAGATDKACHAYGNRYTKRTQTMFQTGGVAYIYLCYGIHHLFNIITNREGVPDAVLIRAIEPHTGIDTMLERRNQSRISKTLTNGPGKMSQALAIHKDMDAVSLAGDTLWLADEGITYSDDQICTSPRIGIHYAEEYVDKPWRFFVQGNRFAG